MAFLWAGLSCLFAYFRYISSNIQALYLYKAVLYCMRQKGQSLFCRHNNRDSLSDGSYWREMWICPLILKYYVWLFIILVIITLLGHGIWVFFAFLFRGSKPIGKRRPCVFCGKSVPVDSRLLSLVHARSEKPAGRRNCRH